MSKGISLKKGGGHLESTSHYIYPLSKHHQRLRIPYQRNFSEKRFGSQNHTEIFITGGFLTCAACCTGKKSILVLFNPTILRLFIFVLPLLPDCGLSSPHITTFRRVLAPVSDSYRFFLRFCISVYLKEYTS